MTTKPKFLHIPKAAKFNVRFDSSVSMCGRLVGRMAMETEAKATCPKCLAESLSKSCLTVAA